MVRRRPAAAIGAALLLVAASALLVWGQAKTPEYVFWPLKRYPRLPYRGRINGIGAVAGRQYVFTTSASMVYAVDLAPLEAMWQADPKAWDYRAFLQAKDSDIAWRFKTKAPVSLPPVVAGGFVVVIDDLGEVYALDQKGRAAWTLATGEPSDGWPVALGERVLVHRKAGHFSVFDGKSGKPGGALTAGGELVDYWLAAEDKLFTIVRSGAIVVLGPDGREVERITGKTPYTGPLAIEKDAILAGIAGGGLESINRKNKKPRWSRPLGTRFRAVAFMGEKMVCALGINDILFCLVRRSGDLKWWRGGDILDIPMPIFWQGRIMGSFGTSEMFGLVDRTGESRYRFDSGTRIVSDFHLWGENLAVHMFDEKTGEAFLLVMGPEKQVKTP